MAMFCYYCGKVGHSERLCQGRKSDAITGKLLEGQYGDWLKADSVRSGTRNVSEREQEQRGPACSTVQGVQAGMTSMQHATAKEGIEAPKKVVVNLKEGFREEMGLLTGIVQGEIYRKADSYVEEQKKVKKL